MATKYKYEIRFHDTIVGDAMVDEVLDQALIQIPTLFRKRNQQDWLVSNKVYAEGDEDYTMLLLLIDDRLISRTYQLKW